MIKYTDLILQMEMHLHDFKSNIKPPLMLDKSRFYVLFMFRLQKQIELDRSKKHISAVLLNLVSPYVVIFLLLSLIIIVSHPVGA